MSQDMIRKLFRGEIRRVDPKNFTVDAVVSDETKDRYNDVVKASAYEKHMKHYKKHPVFLSSHRYGTLQSQIGEAETMQVEGNKLVAKFKYYVGEGNPEADWAFNLAQKRIGAFSVGFINKESKRREDANDDDPDFKGKNPPERVFTEVELLEVSQVTIPANPSALQKGSQDEDVIIRTMCDLIKEAGLEKPEKQEKENKEVSLEDARKAMAKLLGVNGELSIKEHSLVDQYNELKTVYEKHEVPAPVLEHYTSVQKIWKYCLDADTAYLFIKELYEGMKDKHCECETCSETLKEAIAVYGNTFKDKTAELLNEMSETFGDALLEVTKDEVKAGLQGVDWEAVAKECIGVTVEPDKKEETEEEGDYVEEVLNVITDQNKELEGGDGDKGQEKETEKETEETDK